MDKTMQRIADLEWANYAATAETARVTPGLDLTLRDEVIITSSEVFPTPDANHACLLRAAPQHADDLIAEVTAYFQSRGLPTTIYLSPACTPNDLSKRLLKQGFARQEDEEAWMVLDHLLDFDVPSPIPGTAVRRITQDEAQTFAQVFLTAFGMPVDFAPQMTQLLEPSIDLPGVYHYLALVDEEPAGTCSLLCHERFGVLGSAGVVPEHRGTGTATDLVIEAVTEAKKRGVGTLMLQTTADTPLERLLRISGFKRVFTRDCFTLG